MDRFNFKQTVGYWQIGGNYGLRISVLKKPRYLTILLCKYMLEWEWVEEVSK